MYALTDLCKKALVEGRTEYDADELAEEWQDLYTGDEIQDEMHRIVEKAEIYTVCDNRLSAPYSSDIALSDETYYLTEAEARRAAESALASLTMDERERADIYACGPNGFIFYPAIEERRRECGEVECDGQTYVLMQAPCADTRWNGDQIYVADAIKADERDLREAACFRVEWDVINQDAVNEEDCCDWARPSDATYYGAYNLYQDRHI